MARSGIVAVCLCLLLLMAGCGGTETEETMALTIGTMPSLDKVPMLIAVRQGFFENYGLKVEVLNFQSPTDRDAALQSGQLDGIMSDMVATLYYLNGGQGVKMTSLVQTDFVLLASAASGIREVGDIGSEHQNGISLNGLVEYVADEACAAEKLLLPSVMSRVEQVTAGAIDVTIVPEPYGSIAAAKGAVPVTTGTDLGIYGAVMLFTDAAIAEKPDAITAFYRGYEDAVAYLAEADPEDYIDDIVAMGEFSAEAAPVLAATVFTSLEAPAEAQFNAIQDWLNGRGDLSAPLAFSFADHVDLRFLQP